MEYNHVWFLFVAYLIAFLTFIIMLFFWLSLKLKVRQCAKGVKNIH